jgi:DNA-binding transcriptional MocR family regulator
MHSVYLIPQHWCDSDIRNRCEEQGLGIRDLSRYFTAQTPIKGLILGFAGYNEEQILTAVNRLKKIIDAYT